MTMLVTNGTKRTAPHQPMLVLTRLVEGLEKAGVQEIKIDDLKKAINSLK